MKIPTQIWIFCVGIFLQHYTFLQKRTFCILCENFSRFVRKATAIERFLYYPNKSVYLNNTHPVHILKLYQEHNQQKQS